MNNERIDVLAVLDRVASDCIWERDEANANDNEAHGETWERNRADMRAARAAVAELIESLRIAQQALLEVARAQAYGPSWYTKGESGLRSQVDMWVRKGLDATDAALDRVGGAK